MVWQPLTFSHDAQVRLDVNSVDVVGHGQREYGIREWGEGAPVEETKGRETL